MTATLQCFIYLCLAPSDGKQRRMATAYLLEKVPWTGIASEFKRELTAARTRQLCDAMTVTKDLMAKLLLAAGGRGCISTGGGGSTSELTNWDGTKKKTLFDCMNLYARLKEDGKVVVEGVVFYWNPVDGDTQKSAVIRSFKDIDECLNWINSESSARDECVEVLNEHC